VDVLLLVASGFTAPEIATLLHLSEWTIQGHQRRIRGKLGTRTMAHSVAIAAKRGEIDLALIR
jgi:DNA-binding CsgD family transcriptional regulator